MTTSNTIKGHPCRTCGSRDKRACNPKQCAACHNANAVELAGLHRALDRRMPIPPLVVEEGRNARPPPRKVRLPVVDETQARRLAHLGVWSFEERGA